MNGSSQPAPSPSPTRSFLADCYARIRRSGFLRNVGFLLGAAAISQVIGLATSPFLTRIYTPADFGVYQVFTAVLAFATAVVSWRYDIAIPIADNTERAAHLLVLAFSVIIGMTVVTILAGMLWAHYFSLPLVSKTWFLVFLGISLLFSGFVNMLNYWAARERDFKSAAEGRVGQATVQIATMLGAGVWRASVLNLLLADGLGSATNCVWLARRFYRRIVPGLRHVSLRDVISVARRYKDFPLVSSVGGVANIGGIYITPLLLFHFYGPTVAGFFALADRVGGAPSAFISNALSQVYVGEAAAARDNPKALLRLVRNIVAGQAILGAVPYGVLAAVAPTFFSWIFGARWLEAGVYARLMVAASYIGFVIGPINMTLGILERQRWQFVWDVGRMVIVASGWIACAALSAPPWIAVGIYAIIVTLFYLLLLGLALKAILAIPKRGNWLPGQSLGEVKQAAGVSLR